MSDLQRALRDRDYATVMEILPDLIESGEGAVFTVDSLAAALHSPAFRRWAADRLSEVTGMPVASVAAVDDIFADPADGNAKVITEGAAAIIAAAKEATR